MSRSTSRFVAVLALVVSLASCAFVTLAGVPRDQARAATAFNLTAICGDFVQDPSVYVMRLRNPGTTDEPFTWRDRLTGQTGSGTAPAGTDTFFDVLDASRSHTIIVSIGGGQLVKATNTTPCQGRLTVEKRVEGPGTEPPGARYRIRISGDSGFEETIQLAGGESQSFDVPGTIAERSVPIGEVPGGYIYTVSELDGLGAKVTVSPDTLTFNASGSKTSTVTNQFDLSPDPPIPPIPPIPPDPPSADLVLFKDVSPTTATVGDEVTYTIRVENRGPSPAVDVVGLDLPRRTLPNEVAEVLGIETTQGSCTLVRPVRCEFGDLPAGGEITLTARVRPKIVGSLQNLAEVTSSTPDPNISNNQETAGLFVEPGEASLALRKRADRRRVEPGDSVSYSLKVSSEGLQTAVGVEVCDSLPPGLRLQKAPRADLSRGRSEPCWILRQLEPGKSRTFGLSARAVASKSGRSIVNEATAVAENAPDTQARAQVRVIETEVSDEGDEGRGSGGGGGAGPNDGPANPAPCRGLQRRC